MFTITQMQSFFDPNSVILNRCLLQRPINAIFFATICKCDEKKTSQNLNYCNAIIVVIVATLNCVAMFNVSET